MKTVYLLLAAKKFGPIGATRGVPDGGLNAALAQRAHEVLSDIYDVTSTNITDGFDADEERDKLLNSDLVIFQFPMYWFGMPGYLKQYLDDVLISPEFWINKRVALDYGRGGQLRNKYMVSVTTNAPALAFAAGTILEGRSIDDVLITLHMTQKYLGALALPTFAAHNVHGVSQDDMRSDIDYLADYEAHLRRFVLTQAVAE